MRALTVLKGGMLRYQYDAGEDIRFDFHLLCEVGAPYQGWFKREIKRRGLKVETRQLEVKPWVADFVVKQKGDRHEQDTAAAR